MSQRIQAGRLGLMSGEAGGEEGGEEFGGMVAIVRAHSYYKNLGPASIGWARICGCAQKRLHPASIRFYSIYVAENDGTLLQHVLSKA